MGRLELSSTLKSAAADKCLRRAIQGWRFPKPTGRMPLVAFTLSFKLMT